MHTYIIWVQELPLNLKNFLSNFAIESFILETLPLFTISTDFPLEES